MEYEIGTPFAELLDELKKVHACKPALKYCKKALQENRDLTTGELADKTAMDDEADIAWMAWILVTFGGRFSEEVREKFFKKIENPMLSLQLYLKMDFLSGKEDKMLVKRFKGKLPRAEMELRTGIIKRKKV